MAYFNPNRVDFNYNTNMIDAVGAVGRSLWDIYKENVTKNQNQMKINEAKRSNLANEGINQGRLNEDIVHNSWKRNFETSKLNTDNEKWQKDYDLRKKHSGVMEDLKRKGLEDNRFLRMLALQGRQGTSNGGENGAMPTSNGISANVANPSDFFNSNKDNKQFAALFGGLDEETGGIDYQKAAQNFSNYVATNKAWGKNITDRLSKDDGFDKEIAGILEGANKINQAGQEYKTYGKPLDSYDGWGDRFGDWWQEKRGIDNGSQSAQNLVQVLTNAGVQLTKLGRADREIVDLTNKLGVSLDSAILDNDTVLKAERLNKRIFDTTIGDLKIRLSTTKDPYQRYSINQKIKELTAQRDEIGSAIKGGVKKQAGWQSITNTETNKTIPDPNSRPPLESFYK